jgi:methionine biosynthesis protein MetW
MDNATVKKGFGKLGPRADLLLIADMIAPGCRVLDVGCGDGALLKLLSETRDVDARGIEISQEGVNRCVAQGLSVVQGDAHKDLVDYPDQAFDYVVLSQTIQAMHQPHEVLDQLLRIGHCAIVSFPNFGHWKLRLHLLLSGRTPVSEQFRYSWYNTPNIHYCTIRDFVDLCELLGVTIERRTVITGKRQALDSAGYSWFANLFGEQAIFLLRR